MVIGTMTSGAEPDYLMIAKARLPVTELSFSEPKDYNNKDAIAAFTKTENKIEIETKINHQGEVNKARFMPQEGKYNIIATKTTSGEVHIFDYFKHPSKPKDDEVRPELKLYGHSQEGYGLCWSSIKEGYLISGSNDKLICLWDIASKNSQPIKTFNSHTAECEDVSFNKKTDNIFASCGDDKKIIIHDYRTDKPVGEVIGHEGDIYSVDWNPMSEYTLLSASADKTCGLWDTRCLSKKMHSFEHHTDKVLGAKWNSKLPGVFASYSEDRRVLVWDINQIGATIASADNEDGPSELIVRKPINKIFSSHTVVIAQK